MSSGIDKHPLYTAMAERWLLMRDSIEGELKIKDQGEDYLPKPTSMGQPAYEAYKKRATYPEILAPTVRGMHGILHEVEARIELPAVLEPLREKATKNGLNLEDFLRTITHQLLITGRYGVLSDLDASQQPILAGYDAEAIMNWDSNAEEEIELVTLDETRHRRGLDNSWSEVTRVRELTLDENGNYQIRLEAGATGDSNDDENGNNMFRSSDSENTIESDDEVIEVTKRGGQKLDFIPFTFVNTMGNQPQPDEVPLYGMARCATAIYQLDADYRKTLYLSSQPQPLITGIAADDAPTTIGGESIWILPEGATAEFLEFSGASAEAQEKAIEKKQMEAIKLGAKLFEESTGGVESGEALKTRFNTQTATLRTIANSAAMALEKALRNLAIWLNANPDEVIVEAHRDFGSKLTIEEATKVVSLWQSGAITFADMHSQFQSGGLVPRDIEAEDQQEMIMNQLEAAIPEAEEDGVNIEDDPEGDGGTSGSSVDEIIRLIGQGAGVTVDANE